MTGGFKKREGEVLKQGMEKRISYIDTAKAYLILTVILSHVLITMNPDYTRILLSCGQEFFYAFHMPAFFILHGALFSEEKWKEKSIFSYMKKRARALLLPYFGFEAIGIVWRYIFNGQSLRAGFLQMVTIRCNVGADWFLPALFMGTMLMFLDVKISRQKGESLSFIVRIILVISLLLILPDNHLAVVIGRGLMAYLFITVGRAGRTMFLSEKMGGFWWIIATAFLTGACALVNLKFGGNDFYSCTLRNPVTFLLGGVAGCCLILGLSRRRTFPCLEVVGRHTLAVMGTHQLVIYAATALIPSMTGGNLVYGMGLTALILLFEIPLVYVLDHK